jgi:hypothetical protein
MLEANSDAGNGCYGVISSEDQAARYVDQRMLSTLSLIARDMKVQVEFNPTLVSARLAPAAIAPTVEGADSHLAWAISVASFAELLEHSPYSDSGALDTIARVLESQRERDADRKESTGCSAASGR